MSARFKRSVVAIAAAALLAVITASAASARPSAGSATEAAERTLNIYGFGPGDDVANNRAEIARRALGANVDVENPRGSFNDQAFLAMLASGNVPDLVYLGRGAVGTYAAKRAFIPLANCIRSENIPVSQYRAAALREVTYRGQRYGIPEFTQPITLIVNNSVLKAHKIAPANVQTKNWKTLARVNRDMMQHAGGGKITRIGFDPKIPEFFPLWAKANGHNLLSSDGLRAQLNHPKAVEALAFTYSLIRAHGGFGPFKAFRDTWDFFGRQNQVVLDQVGAWPMESWYYNVLADNSPNVDITAKYFVNKKGGPITMFSGSAWAIPRGAKDPDLACKWAKAMTATETWVAVARERRDVRRRQNRAFTGLYTANTRADIKIYEDVYQSSGKPQFDHAVRLLANVSRYGFALPPSPASAEFRQAYTDAINRVLSGRQTPRQALNQAQREAQAAINKNRPR